MEGVNGIRGGRGSCQRHSGKVSPTKAGGREGRMVIFHYSGANTKV